MNDHELFESEAFGLPSELEGLTDALAAAEDRFLDRANVVGVGLGHKIKDGEQSDDAQRDGAGQREVAGADAGPRDKVSKTVDSKPTDVLEVGHLFAGGERRAGLGRWPLQAVDAQTLATRVRPVRPGYSVGHPKVTAGTIGAGCYDLRPLPGKPTKYYILSNNHVLANSNNASLGDPIYQPGTFDGGGPADAIGRLARYMPIKFDGSCNYVDAAIAEVPFDTIDRDIYWNGYPTTAAVAATVGHAGEEDRSDDALHDRPGDSARTRRSTSGTAAARWRSSATRSSPPTCPPAATAARWCSTGRTARSGCSSRGRRSRPSSTRSPPCRWRSACGCGPDQGAGLASRSSSARIGSVTTTRTGRPATSPGSSAAWALA